MNAIQAHRHLQQLGDEFLGMHLSLEAPARVLHQMGDPQRRHPCVLVGGTNGKGSVCHFTAAVLQQAGYRVGLYTSPHLVSVTERIRIGGRAIADADLVASLTRVVDAQEQVAASRATGRRLTYFETVTLTAFDCFSRHPLDLLILEVGLGGRLDATNLTDPVVSAISSIAMDHAHILGDTPAAIAREKGAIGRPGRPLLVGPVEADAAAAILEAAAGSDVRFLDPARYPRRDAGMGRYCLQATARPDLPAVRLRAFGAHQADNAALALEIVESLGRRGFPVSPSDMVRGLEATEIPGRLQQCATRPALLVDGAHNPAAARALADFITPRFPAGVHMVFGMMRDKDIAACARILAPLARRVFLVPLPGRRAASTSELLQHFPPPLGIAASGPHEALARALEAAGEGGAVLACGSLALAGALLARLRPEEFPPPPTQSR